MKSQNNNQEQLNNQEQMNNEAQEILSDDEETTLDNDIEPAEIIEEKAEPNWKDAYMRMAADFDNFKKRNAADFDDARRRERERVLKPWLDVYDNAERAIASCPEKSGPWHDGFVALIKQMDSALAQFSIKAFDSINKKFDPTRHDAIATLPSPNLENDTIMHVEQTGFEYDNGTILRPARVVVVKNS